MIHRFKTRNRKGITPIIAVILLLMMTVAIAGLAYVFIQRYSSSAEATAENTTARTSQSLKSNLKIDGYNTTCGAASGWVLVRVSVRNAGQEAARNVQLFVDDNFLNGSTNTSLLPGISTSYLLQNDTCPKWINQTRTLKLSSDEMDAQRPFTFICHTGSC